MKTPKNPRSTDYGRAVVVSSTLSPKLTKVKLIELFEKELEKRKTIIHSLKVENHKLDKELRVARAKSCQKSMEIDDLHYKVNVLRSETAQIRRIETLELQLERVEEEVKYYKNRFMPVKRWVVLPWHKSKINFGDFFLSVN